MSRLAAAGQASLAPTLSLLEPMAVLSTELDRREAGEAMRYDPPGEGGRAHGAAERSAASDRLA